MVANSSGQIKQYEKAVEELTRYKSTSVMLLKEKEQEIIALEKKVRELEAQQQDVIAKATYGVNRSTVRRRTESLEAIAVEASLGTDFTHKNNWLWLHFKEAPWLLFPLCNSDRSQ